MPTRQEEFTSEGVTKTLEKTSTKIFTNADHLQVGTIMYSETNVGGVARKFMPIFPFLYDDLKNGQLLSGAQFYMPKPP